MESNRLIAEFLGANYNSNYHEFEMYGIIESIKDGENEQHFFLPSQMLFKTDWNWLMKVVVECFDKSDELYDNGDDKIFKLNDALLETNIESLYKAVVEFIEWYNENKN